MILLFLLMHKPFNLKAKSVKMCLFTKSTREKGNSVWSEPLWLPIKIWLNIIIKKCFSTSCWKKNHTLKTFPTRRAEFPFIVKPSPYNLSLFHFGIVTVNRKLLKSKHKKSSVIQEGCNKDTCYNVYHTKYYVICQTWHTVFHHRSMIKLCQIILLLLLK